MGHAAPVIRARACSWGLATVLLAVSTLAHAQWQTVTGSPPGAREDVQIARVSNRSGDTLSVFVDADDTVRAQFDVADVLTPLDPQTCPTYLVDDGAPKAARFGPDRCLVAGGRAIFALGVVALDAIASDALLNLMNGTVVTIRYHTDGVGYRDAQFSLRGSKQALNAAIGSGVRVVSQ